MKAKLILTAMAMPVLFAACTSDELVPMEQTQQQVQRPLLNKDFKLNAKIEGDAETRYSAKVDENGLLKFSWENEDSYGALLIDQPNTGAVETWGIIAGSGGNTEFKYDATKYAWVGESQIGVGHYLFVYPHAAADDSRLAASYSLPTVQKLYEGENETLNLNAAIEAGNKAVGAQLLKEKDTETDVDLKNLYAYPKFKVQFDNSADITKVYKVVLEYDNGAGGFAVAGGIAHEKVWNLFNNPNTKWEDKQTSAFVISKSEAETVDGKYYKYTNVKTSPYIVAQFPETGVGVVTDPVTLNKSFEVRFMIPGEKMNNLAATTGYVEKLAMYVYTDDGVYELNGINLYDAIKFKDTTSDNVKKNVFARNTAWNLTLKPDAFKKSTTMKNIVANETDWNNLVARYGKTNDIEVIIVGEDFTIGENTDMPEKTFTVKSDIAVSGDKLVENVTVEENYKIIVNSGVTLSVNGSLTAKTIENNGTVNFEAKLSEDDDILSYSNVQKVVNNGVVNIDEDAVVAFSLENKKSSTLNNEGEATLNSGSTNLGTINNSAQLDVAGLTNKVDEWNSTAHIYKVVGTIKNTVDGTIMSVAPSGLINNAYAQIVNEGELTCSNIAGGTILNAGTLDAKGAVNYITYNKSGNDLGTIKANAAWPSNIEVTHDKGIIEYTTTGGTINFGTNNNKSLVNKLNVSSSLTIGQNNNGNVSTINVNGTADLNLYHAVANLNINAGTTTLTSNITVGTMLNVAKSAKVIVPAGKSLTVSDGMDNDGTISVAGTFTASNVYKDNSGDGKVTESGSSSKITWKHVVTQQEIIEAAEGEYNAAVKNAVAAYWNACSDGAYSNWQLESYSDLKTNIENTKVPEVVTARGVIITKYNAWKKLLNSEFVEVTELNEITELDNDKYNAESKTYKGEAVTKAYGLINTFLTSGNAAKVADFKTKWLTGAKNIGFATTGIALELKDMYLTYLSFVNSQRDCWIPATDTEKNAMEWAISDEWTRINTVADKDYAAPGVTIPENSYLDASGTDNTVYNAVKLWIDAKNVFADSNKYDGSAAGTTVKGIQNWFIAVAGADHKNDVDRYNAIEKAKDLLDSVRAWSGDPYSDKNFEALVSLIDVTP